MAERRPEVPRLYDGLWTATPSTCTLILVLILVFAQHAASLLAHWRLPLIVVVLLLLIHKLVLLSFLEDFAFGEAPGGHAEGLCRLLRCLER